MNTPVTKQEIIDALQDLASECEILTSMSCKPVYEFANRIKTHGIAQEPSIQQLIGEIDGIPNLNNDSMWKAHVMFTLDKYRGVK